MLANDEDGSSGAAKSLSLNGARGGHGRWRRTSCGVNPNLNMAKNTQKLPRKRLPVLKVTPQRQIRDLHTKPRLLVQL